MKRNNYSTRRRSQGDQPRGQYLPVEKETTLLSFLFESLKDRSKSAVKSLLSHRQILVNDQVVTQFDTPVQPGDKVMVSYIRGKVEFNNRLLNFSYLTLGLLAACALLLIILFVFFVVHPIHKIAKSVARYADGDFSKKIDVHTNDEIGYLAASIDYMANEMNTLEEDQRKFVSNVSHDFRSPLTSIKGYVEAMLDGTIPPELQDKYLNIILFETERLNKLTNSILELNKYGSHGRTILDTGNFDINHVIKMTAMTFEGRCKEKHLSFELILTGQTLFVRADMSKIEQVVYNLIDNAIKFSHNDSTITIETTEKNGKVFVSVKDTGIGIPKDSLNKIWERFYKTDLSRGKDKKGTGLGLAIVKEIIQAHGENINVISTEGVGTEFIFTLPLAKEKSAGSEN